MWWTEAVGDSYLGLAVIRELLGEDRLERIVVEDSRSGKCRTLGVRALFVFIGAEANTGWLRGAVELDARGFVLTGGALDYSVLDGNPWRSLSREPYPLETSLPGVFAVGDVRSGSIKQVASAVGEGSMAVRLVHQYLDDGDVHRAPGLETVPAQQTFEDRETDTDGYHEGCPIDDCQLSAEQLETLGLTGFLEGLAQEQASFFPFLLCTGLLQDGLHGLLDGFGLECDVWQGDDDLPDLAVDKVGFARVYPPAAGEDPGPAFHADGVLYVLVLEAEHLDPEPVGRYDLWLYADRRWHGDSLAATL